MDGGYKLENISQGASNCLGSTYLLKSKASGTSDSAGSYFSQEPIDLSSEDTFTTPLWSLQNGTKHYLSARATCDDEFYTYTTEMADDGSTDWNFIPSLVYGGVYYIENAKELSTCHNSFM